MIMDMKKYLKIMFDISIILDKIIELSILIEKINLSDDELFIETFILEDKKPILIEKINFPEGVIETYYLSKVNIMIIDNHKDKNYDYAISNHNFYHKDKNYNYAISNHNIIRRYKTTITEPYNANFDDDDGDGDGDGLMMMD